MKSEDIKHQLIKIRQNWEEKTRLPTTATRRGFQNQRPDGKPGPLSQTRPKQRPDPLSHTRQKTQTRPTEPRPLSQTIQNTQTTPAKTRSTETRQARNIHGGTMIKYETQIILTVSAVLSVVLSVVLSAVLAVAVDLLCCGVVPVVSRCRRRRQHLGFHV